MPALAISSASSANTTENVSIPNKSFMITQCTVARITALDPTKPAVDISTPDTIVVIGLDTVGGTIGWLLQTDGHELRGVRAKGATEAGIEIEGSGNRVSWNLVKKNGVGIVVSGSGNDLRGGTVEKSTGNGVQFSATAQANVLQGADIQLNGGNGILIEGSAIRSGTTRAWTAMERTGWWSREAAISSRAMSSGATRRRVMARMASWSRVPAIRSTATRPAPTSATDSTSVEAPRAVPTALKGNQSNVGGSGQNKENKGAEYRLANGVMSLDGNKADGASVAKAAKCLEFPKKNETKDFATPFLCE